MVAASSRCSAGALTFSRFERRRHFVRLRRGWFGLRVITGADDFDFGWQVAHDLHDFRRGAENELRPPLGHGHLVKEGEGEPLSRPAEYKFIWRQGHVFRVVAFLKNDVRPAAIAWREFAGTFPGSQAGKMDILKAIRDVAQVNVAHNFTAVESFYSRGSSGVQLGGFSPAAAQGTVKLDHAEKFIATGLSEAEFRVEKFLLVVEHFKVAGDAALVTNIGHVGRVAVGLRQLLLLLAKLAVALVGNKTVGNFPKGVLHRLLVARERFLKARLGQFQFAPQPPTGKQRHRDRRAKLPGSRRTGKQVRQRDTLEPEEAGQG